MKRTCGFTFIEVMLAMAIFVMTVVYSINLSGGSLRAVRDSKDVSQASWLLQNIMVQLETRLETEGFDKGCEKKKEAKFDPPYERFTWVTFCTQIDFNVSQSAAAMSKENPDESDPNSQENMISKAVMATASDYLSKSIRELHVEVSWLQGKTKRTVDASTFVARYDQPLVMAPVSR